MLGETIRTSRMFRTVKDMKRKRTRFRRTSRAVSLTAAVLVIGLAAVGLAAILSGGSWAVSYTHLTLPANREVSVSWGVATFQKKNRENDPRGGFTQ